MTIILKLSNGTEVVGDLLNKNGHSFTISKPLQINYRYYQGSVPSISFVRYIMFSDSENVTFNFDDVMHNVTAREAFARYYTTVVDNYYGELEKVVDKEFDSAAPITNKDQLLTAILDQMSIDEATVN